MPLTMQEEIALRAAWMEIRRERKNSLRDMFTGTQLKRKSAFADAKSIADDAKKAKKAVAQIPGLDVPEIGVPSLNLDLLKRLDLPKLVDLDIPRLTFPGWQLDLIPDISLGDLPGFDLSAIKLNLKGIKIGDWLPDISLRGLVWSISMKFPHLQLPAICLDLGKLLRIDLLGRLPTLKLAFPEFFDVDLELDLPNLRMPDVNFPRLPYIDLKLPDIDLGDLEIPGLDLPTLLKIPGFDRVLRLLVELFDAVDLPEIVAELGLDVIKDFISSALPIVQQVKSGSKAAMSWGKAAQDLHKSSKVRKHMPFIVPGDARSACMAVRTLLKESSAEHATRATIETAQFAVSTAGLFADLGGATGPATSAAAALAKLCQKITIFALKYKEMKKINLLLRTSPEDQLADNIFTVSPLLGCYYLANNTTSNCLNVLVANILEDDWMREAELNKKRHLDPLISDAQKFIDRSSYVLFPIRQNKGMFVEKSLSERMKEGFMLSMKKKFGMAPKTAQVSRYRNIGTR